jgi:hypothetical protein
VCEREDRQGAGQQGEIIRFSIARRFVSPGKFSLGKSLIAISSARTVFLVWKFSVGIAMLNIRIDHHAVHSKVSGTVPTRPMHVYLYICSACLRDTPKPPRRLCDTCFIGQCRRGASVGRFRLVNMGRPRRGVSRSTR